MSSIAFSAKISSKNAIATPWTLYSKLFAPQAFSPVSSMSLNDKLDIYFQDHSLMPLFVQQNYLSNTFSKSSQLQGEEQKMKRLELASKAADAISDGDLVDGLIHQYVLSIFASIRFFTDIPFSLVCVTLEVNNGL